MRSPMAENSECIPTLRLLDRGGSAVEGDPIARAAGMLKSGNVLAVKDPCGFHLICDAVSTTAVRRLRQLLLRPYAPLAVMVANTEPAAQWCEIDDHDRSLLDDPIRPIVILRQKPAQTALRDIAPGLDTLGVRLPYAPHHHRLFAQGLAALVYTGAGIAHDREAQNRFRCLVDGFLTHDQPLERSMPETVLQPRNAGRMVLRPGRGLSPQTFDLGQTAPDPILAVGTDNKNTVALVEGGRAVVSEQIGDLADDAAFGRFKQVIAELTGSLKHPPRSIAADLDGDGRAAQYANQQLELEMIQVQHHHAHAVSCMVEHGLNEPLIAVVADGTGLGPDGTLWGGELLLAERAAFQRLGHLQYYRLPGGRTAARQTFRPALALLHQVFGDQTLTHPVAAELCPDRRIRKAILDTIVRQIDSPPTSSLGRLFDAAAAITGLAGVNYHAAHGPMLLEAQANGRTDETYGYELTRRDGLLILQPQKIIRQMAADVESATDLSLIADRFHNAVAAMLAEATAVLANERNCRRVVLSGGCFANRYLSRRLRENLERSGLECYEHREIPCSAEGISLGQAACAAARRAAGMHDD